MTMQVLVYNPCFMLAKINALRLLVCKSITAEKR